MRSNDFTNGTITLWKLNVFAIVYEEKSMTKAAEKLFLTQPSISQIIKEIENYYDVSLFTRAYHSLAPTNAGDKLFRYAKQILELIDDIETDLRGESLTKNLVVGANYAVGSKLLFKFADHFRSLHSDINLRLTVDTSDLLMQRLSTGNIHLALMEEQADSSEWSQNIFYVGRSSIVVAPSHPLAQQQTPVTPQQLAKEKLLLSISGTDIRTRFDKGMQRAGCEVKAFFESSSLEMLAAAAMDGEGVANIPHMLAEKYIESGQLVELKTDQLDLSRRLAIVMHKDRKMTKSISDFISTVFEVTEGKS